MKIWMIIAIVILAWYLISTRNRFEKLRRSVQNAGSQISVYKKKRDNCLLDAMRIAKVSYSHEVDGIERLTAKDQLNQLAFLGEKYPGLQSVSGYNHILNQAFVLNEDITATETILNGNITSYNDAITAFPGLLVAMLFGYKKEKFIDEENLMEHRQVEKIQLDFSQF